jgi:hypothetical protein
MLVFNNDWVSLPVITKNGRFPDTEVQYYATKSVATAIITSAAALVQSKFTQLKAAIDSTTATLTVEIGLHQSEGGVFDVPYHFTVRCSTLAGAFHLYVKLNDPALGKECYGLQFTKATHSSGEMAVTGAPVFDAAVKHKKRGWAMSSY